MSASGPSAPSIQLIAGTDPATVPDQAQESNSAELPAHDATVGTLAGEASVSGGSASYSVPIVIPPGRAGMAPSVSLNYSSRAGNGVAGMGWSIGGLSSISRCPQTVEQDGQALAVTFASTDRLCLDGTRLVPTAGTYGAVNTTYATEIQSFSRITQLGGDLASATSYFKVEFKNGQVAWYGATATSANAGRVIPGGKTQPLTWMLVRQEDRVGNTVLYNYQSFGDGETLPSTIQYTGYTSTAGNRSITFGYELRPTASLGGDQSTTYLSGGVLRQTRRLNNILTKVGTENVRDYRLTYVQSTSSGRSLLSSLQECAWNGTTSVCRPATTFRWQQGPATYQFGSSVVSGSPTMYPVGSSGDLNGDGARDLEAVDGGGNRKLISLRADRTASAVMELPPIQAGAYINEFADVDGDGRADAVWKVNGETVVDFWRGPVSATTYAAAFTQRWNTGIVEGEPRDVVRHVGDMNGDGLADFVRRRIVPGNAMSCRGVLEVLLTQRAANGALSIGQTVSSCMAGTMLNLVDFGTEEFGGVDDFNGDGLPDIWVMDNVGAGVRVAQLQGRRTTAGYSLQRVTYDSLFIAGSPAGNEEKLAGFYRLDADVNGDGLTDLLFARRDGATGRWSIRLNRGGVYGPRINTTSNAGIEFCAGTACANAQISPAWAPRYAGLIQSGDSDNDGRMEILIPRSFAARVCTTHYPDCGGSPLRAARSADGSPLPGLGEATNPYASSPIPSSERQRVDQSAARRSLLNQPAGLQCYQYTACPELPTSSAIESSVYVAQNWAGNGSWDTNGDGSLSAADGQLDAPVGMYGSDFGLADQSVYRMAALRFVETGLEQFEVREASTPLMRSTVESRELDLYGDGNNDTYGRFGCQFSSPDQCMLVVADGNGASNNATAPTVFPDGTMVAQRLLAMEGLGPSTSRNPDGVTPQNGDLIATVTDGFGNETIWTYYPLSSKAGRAAGQTPLYAIPSEDTQRYVDDRHIYFASSMPVVGEMSRSDGLGGYRTWRYGYEEAMYNNLGRGFQGFRKIVEEDVTAGLRTTTVFHQKHPLTGQMENRYVSSMALGATAARLSQETWLYRCNIANRADTGACPVPLGSNAVRFPYLDTYEKVGFDLASAEAGAPKITTFEAQYTNDSANCDGVRDAASGYDAHGNLLRETRLTTEFSDGSSPGFKNYTGLRCVRTQQTYQAADTTNWWLDRLSQRTVTRRITFDAGQSLPGGVPNPTQVTTTNYTWNSNRTPATEVVQPGIANQTRTTTYGYPTGTSNFGLPTSVTVNASGDPNGNRVTSTTYSTDGYFPLTITNPVGHAATTVTRTRDGLPSQVTDPNGRRITTTYDAFGFATLATSRASSNSALLFAPDRRFALQRCAPGVGACGAAVLRFVRYAAQDGSPTTMESMDALGRAWWNAERRSDGEWKSFWREFDTRGRLSRESGPMGPGDSPVFTSYQYDTLDRMTRKTEPQANHDGRGDRITTYTFVGRQTQISVCGSNDAPAACLSMWRVVDERGKVVETRDAANGSTATWFDADGNPLAIRDPNGSVLWNAYNALGQRTSSSDPNQGSSSATYNALGEVLTQTDARGIVTSFQYDRLSRPTQRSATYVYTQGSAATTVRDNWTYDPANGRGQPATSVRTVGTTEYSRETFSYDAFARPIQTAYSQFNGGTGVTATQKTAYDGYYGRPKAVQYASGETVRLVYSRYGHAVREADAGSGVDYRVQTAVNRFDAPTSETLANGITATRSYHPTTGVLTGITWTRGGTTLRALSYTYDVFGNLRTSGNGSTTESFAYDVLQRLTTATRVGGVNGTVSYGYDAAGNLQRKSDFSLNSPGAYQYTGGSCGGGPNAVKSVQLATGGTRSYCYDAAGNLTSDNAGFTARYDATQRPLQVTRSANTTSFDYRPDGERFRQTGSVTRHYFPGVERDASTERTTIGSTLITHQGGQRLIRTLLLDRLGSVEAVADGASVLETRSFDAFGKPRQGSYADAIPARLPTGTNTPRGFTGHEHLDTVDVIHMNGRAYDPALGRFLGVDPIIQFPTNSQSLNPYSYILNNPLAGTDPTGYAMAGPCRTYGVNADGCDVDIRDTKAVYAADTGGSPSSGMKAAMEMMANFQAQRAVDRRSVNGAAAQGTVTTGGVTPVDEGAAARRDEVAPTSFDAYLGMTPDAYWSSIPISEGDNVYSSNADVRRAARSVNEKQASGIDRVQASAEMIAAIKRIAAPTWNAQQVLNTETRRRAGPQEFFLFGRLDSSGSAEIIGAYRVPQGGSFDRPPSAQFAAHWHYRGMGFLPGPGDHSGPKGGLPSFVVTPNEEDRCCNVWEVGRFGENDYRYRSLDGSTPGPWIRNSDWR